MRDRKEQAKQELDQAKARAQDATETAKREAQKSRDTVAETVKELKAAVDWVGGPPAENPDEAEDQIAALRARLERDVDTLKKRVPEPSQIDTRTKRVAGGVAAGAAVVTAGLSAARRRGARRERQRQFRDQALSIARELARLDLDRVMDEVADELAEEQGPSRVGRVMLMLLGLLAGLAVTWLTRQPDLASRLRPN